jgi:hypothetical protein
MCFVTYLPYQEGFILTSNRDESIGRPKASPPKKYKLNQQSVFYPKDGLAGGTWIATSTDWTLCLLNGAFVKHQHNPPYLKSRGLVILDFLEQNNLEEFISSYDLSGVEPFTLVVVEHKYGLAINELRWDGTTLHHKPLLTNMPYSWSSVTLYSDQVIEERQQWFAQWQQKNPDFEGDTIVDFHRFGGKGDIENDLIVNRNNELQTVSITQIQKTPEQFLMGYYDRLNGQEYRYRIFETEAV